MSTLKNSKKSYREQWYRQHRFERNLNRITEMRLRREQRKADLLSSVPESRHWDSWKWNAVGDMWLLMEAQEWMEVQK